MTENPPMQGEPKPLPQPTPNALTDPANAPLGTIVVFPRWQDGHHPTDIAIRWSTATDEERPWLILGSDGPQRLSNDSVDGCQVLPDMTAEAACWHAAYPRRWVLPSRELTDQEMAEIVKVSAVMPVWSQGGAGG